MYACQHACVLSLFLARALSLSLRVGVLTYGYTAYLKGIQHADRSSNIRPLQHKHTHTTPRGELCQQLCYRLLPRPSALCLRAVSCLPLQSLRPLQPLHPLHLQCKDAER